MSQASPTPPTVTPPAAASSRPLLVVIVLGFSSLCASLMQSLVIPIQSELPELLNTSAANTSWIVTATLLGGAIGMPVAGRLGDIHGKKPVLVVAASIMLFGSLIAALSGSFLIVLTGRVLQGIAMGYIPVAISLVKEVVPPRMVNPSIATISATLGVGGALGLPLAAWIVESVDWHALFWLSAVLAAVMVVLSAAVLPKRANMYPAPFDYTGSAGLALGLVGVLVGVTKGNDWGWLSPLTFATILLGVAVLALWGRYELRSKDPLVDLRTTARKPVLLTNLAALLVGFGMMSATIVIPQLLQVPTEAAHGLGKTVMETGLWMAPGGFAMLALSPVSSMLLTRFGGRITLALGAVVIASAYVFGIFMIDSPWKLMVVASTAAAGVGIGYAAMPALILKNVPEAEAGSSVGVNALMRSMGTTISGAVMAIVLTSQTTTLPASGETVPTLNAFLLCFGLGAAAAAAGAVVTLCIPRTSRKKPESAMDEAAADQWARV